MKAGRLKAILANIDDDTEVFIRNSYNPLGTMQDLEQVEESSYGFFGTDIPCVILNTNGSKQLELNEEEDVIDFLPKKKAK